MKLAVLCVLVAILIAQQVLAQKYRDEDEENGKRYRTKSKYNNDDDEYEGYKPSKQRSYKRRDDEGEYDEDEDRSYSKKGKGSYDRYQSGKKDRYEDEEARERNYRTSKKDRYPSYKRPAPKRCNSCSSLLDYTLVTMVLGCRDRVAVMYYDKVRVPEVILDLLTPEMDLCLNGPVDVEADPKTYIGTNDTLVLGFVKALGDPSCRSALNKTVELTFSKGQVASVKPKLKEDLDSYFLERVSKKCVTIILKSIESCDFGYNKS